MRKSEREVKDKQAIQAILDGCAVCRVGFSDRGQPYIVPMNFGYEWSPGDGLVLYFHGAPVGRKLDILKENNRVCFEMDLAGPLRTGELACRFSMNYESIIGFGNLVQVHEPQKKRAALDIIMRHYAGQDAWAYDERTLSVTTVLRLAADHFTAKRLDQ